MFRAIRRTRLCVTACGIMHPRCCRPVAWKRRNSTSKLSAGNIGVHYTTSCNTQSSPPDCPKHVELIGIINKPLLLHLFGCLYYLYCTLILRNIHIQTCLKIHTFMFNYSFTVPLIYPPNNHKFT